MEKPCENHVYSANGNDTICLRPAFIQANAMVGNGTISLAVCVECYGDILTENNTGKRVMRRTNPKNGQRDIVPN